MKRIISLLVFVVSLTTVAQESVLLRYNYNKGDKNITKVNLTQDIPMMGKMKMEMYMLMEIIEVKDTAYVVNISFEKIKNEMLSKGTKYDSTMKESEMDEDTKKMHTSMKPLLEMVIQGRLSKRGEMSDVKVVKGEGNIDSFKSQMNNSLVFPKTAVKVGDSWNMTDKKQTGMGMEMDIKYTYTVKSIQDKNVNLDLSGKVSGFVGGKISGAIVVEKSTGISSNVDMKMELSVFGQKMNSIVKTTTKLK